MVRITAVKIQKKFKKKDCSVPKASDDDLGDKEHFCEGLTRIDPGNFFTCNKLDNG